jgi:alkylated DNA repair protein alkB family protein 7
MHLASWPEDEIPGLGPVLKRLYSLCPTQDTQTHLLHLASCGVILPHIDNLSASGSWILGVSLGSERTLRMQASSTPCRAFDVSLPSGSVYLQKCVLFYVNFQTAHGRVRDAMRFTHTHSILPCNSHRLNQRLSIMIRVRLLVK